MVLSIVFKIFEHFLFWKGRGGGRTTLGLMTYITFHAPRHKKTGIYLYIVLGGRDLNGFKDIEDFLILREGVSGFVAHDLYASTCTI